MKDDSHVFRLDGVGAPRLRHTTTSPAEANIETKEVKSPVINAPPTGQAPVSKVDKIGAKTPDKSPATRTVHFNIHLSLPDWQQLKQLPQKLQQKLLTRLPINNLTRRQLIMAAAGIAGVTIIGCGLLIFNRRAQPNVNDVKAAQIEQQAASFTPLVPEDTKVHKVTPRHNPERNLVSYVDSLKGASLTVSQQKLPLSAKDNKDFLAKAAESAPGIKKAVLTTKGNAIVATDPISQQQTVVFTTDDVLVFIRTPKLLQDSDWIEYVSKLK